MIPSVVVCLRTGGDYRIEHVFALERQIAKHTTLPYQLKIYSDLHYKGWIPLKSNYPGWWSCTELWRNQGPTIAMGLDTVILGNMDFLLEKASSLGPNDVLLTKSPFHDGQLVNAIQVWNGDLSWLYTEFNYEEQSKLYRGDENYMIDKLEKAGAELKPIEDSFVNICNYRKHFVTGVSTKPKVVYFHGQPRPWKTPLWKRVK